MMSEFHQPPIFVNMAGPDDDYTVSGDDGGLLKNAVRFQEADDMVKELRRHLYGAAGKSFQDYLKLCRELFEELWAVPPTPPYSVALYQRAKNLLGIS